MEPKKFPWLTCSVIIFSCICLVAVTAVGGLYYKRNSTAIWSYLDIPTKISGGNPFIQEGAQYALTQYAQTAVPASTLTPGPTPTGTWVPTPTLPPTPTLQPVDVLRIVAPDTANFQDWIRHANVIKGSSVLLLDSGEQMYGTYSFQDTRTVGESIPFPLTIVFGGVKYQVYDETFTSTVAARVDEGLYLPAILNNAVVVPNLMEPQEHVLLQKEDGTYEEVLMYTGTVEVPVAYTCWRGFGVDPWNQRQEPGKVSRYEKIRDAVYWNTQAALTGDVYANWALSRFRWASTVAAYNALFPVGADGHRQWTELAKIHNGTEQSKGSLYDLTTSSGDFSNPSAYNLLLDHFNARNDGAYNTYAQEHGYSRITAVHFLKVEMGEYICGTDTKLMDAQLEQTLAGQVPDNYLLNDADLKPELNIP